MTENIEGQEPHNSPEGTGTPEVSEVTISQKELDDLKHRAEVSSQNFARLKKLEEEHEALEAKLVSNSVPSDPDVARVDKLEEEISSLKSSLNKRDVLDTYPALKDMWPEFEEFRDSPENKGMNLKTASKAFLLDKGLLEAPRKGLEKATGGPRTPVSSGMSTEEVKRLRETDYKKYLEMVEKNLIVFSQ